MKISSLVEQDLVRAFNNPLGLPNIKEALAVEARQIFDLKVGVSFTRLLTQ